MNKIENLIEELQGHLNDIQERICDYTSDYISDRISDIADGSCDIYYSDLIQWLKDDSTAPEYIEEAVKEFGIDSHNFDFLRLLQQGQYYKAEQELYDDVDKMLLFYAYNYIKDKGIEEITDEQNEELEDICKYNDVDRFSIIDSKIDDLLENTDDEEENND